MNVLLLSLQSHLIQIFVVNTYGYFTGVFLGCFRLASGSIMQFGYKLAHKLINNKLLKKGFF